MDSKEAHLVRWGIAFTQGGNHPRHDTIIGWMRDTGGEPMTWLSKDDALEENDMTGWTGYVAEYTSEAVERDEDVPFHYDPASRHSSAEASDPDWEPPAPMGLVIAAVAVGLVLTAIPLFGLVYVVGKIRAARR